MLYTRSIYSPPTRRDGIRVSVMSRHTLCDGVTPDARITHEQFDYHWSLLAPSPALIGDYYRRGICWSEFDSRYREQMQDSRANVALNRLAQLATITDVTILCVEGLGEPCHRRILAELCQIEQCHLRVEHR